MSFSYNPDLSSVVDIARAMVGDTDAGDYVLDDELINLLAEDEPNKYKLAAKLCRVIAAHYSKDLDIEDDSAKFESTTKAENYRKLALDYEKQAKGDADAAEEEEENETPEELTDLSLLLPKGASSPPAFTRNLHRSS